MDRGRCVPIDVRLNQLADEVKALETANAVIVQDEGTPLGSFHTINVISAIAAATDAGGGVANITVTGTAGSQNLFETVAVDGQGSIVATGTTDTLTVEASDNIVLTTDVTDKILRIGVTGINVFDAIAVSGEDTITADTISEELTLVAGSNMTITTNNTTKTITFASSGGGGSGDAGQTVWGTLNSDLTEDAANVVLNVTRYTGSTDPGATVTIYNADNLLHPTASKYFWLGNATGQAQATFSASSGHWEIDWVQPPTSVPT